VPAPEAVGAQRGLDDGSVLEIDDEAVVDNDGNRVNRTVEASCKC
jgi:hypothetical protein